MLDPQTRTLLDTLESLGVPPMHALPPVQAREAYKRARAATQREAPAVAATRMLSAPGPAGPIPIREHRAAGTRADEPLPALVYLHGGGWTIGDLDTHDLLCRELANRARCAVLSVDYRLAPEHRFPAAVEDTIAALRWIAAEAAQLKLDPARIAIGGDSAGGNLATVAAIDARDRGSPALVLQLLIYPATDFHADTPSHRENAQGYVLTRDAIDYFERHYLPGPHCRDDWRASPLLAPDLSRLPPALVLTAGYDPLRDEGHAYAQRLEKAGVAVDYHCFSGQIHGFVLMGKWIDEAYDAMERCAVALRRAFGS